jgi:hypothetical protein
MSGKKSSVPRIAAPRDRGRPARNNRLQPKLPLMRNSQSAPPNSLAGNADADMARERPAVPDDPHPGLDYSRISLITETGPHGSSRTQQREVQRDQALLVRCIFQGDMGDGPAFHDHQPASFPRHQQINGRAAELGG